MNNGFIKVDMISPKLKVGNPSYNILQILESLKDRTSDIALFPELSITSYSCQDLFLYDEIQNENNKALEKFLKENTYQGLVVLGGILSYESALFNVAYVIKNSEVIGVVPKYYLPNYQEFSEARWFTSGLISKRLNKVKVLNKRVPFGKLIFNCTSSLYKLGIGIEICEDVWAPISPSNIMSLNGANVFLNLSASNEYLGKNKKRENMVSEASRKNRGAYIYTSANASESSTGLVFSSSQIASIYGDNLVADHSLTFETKITSASIDLGYIENLRKKDSPYKESLDEFDREFTVIDFTLNDDSSPLLINPHPFYLEDGEKENYKRIIELQAFGFSKRLKHTNSKKIILGVSGGLDSTMSLLAAYRTVEILGLDPKEAIIPVCLPHENSTVKTKTNSEKLIKALGLTALVIPIDNAVEEVLKSTDIKDKNVAYENAQVRVRTTILMELANKYNGLMLGTSDLSEIAMGYSTYNGDNMSMYNINSSLPKTMIRSIVKNYAKDSLNEELKKLLIDIVDTPISAELNIGQLTENEIGKYEYIDFILFRYIRRGDSKERIKKIMPYAFDLSSDEIELLVEGFFKRFIAQQYKRNASPDGIKVTNVSLDSHLDFKMVSDVDKK